MKNLLDPQALGEALLSHKRQLPGMRMSEVADHVLGDNYNGDPIPSYASTFTDHAAIRRQELEARAANGDRHAAALLKGQSLAEEPVD